MTAITAVIVNIDIYNIIVFAMKTQIVVVLIIIFVIGNIRVGIANNKRKEYNSFADEVWIYIVAITSVLVPLIVLFG